MENKKNKANKIAKGLLKYLSVNNEEGLLPLVVGLLSKKVAKRIKVRVTTPVVLTIGQKRKAQDLSRALIKEKSVEVVYEVDPEIVDGMRIRYGDKLWDLSLVGIIEGFKKTPGL